MYCGKCGTENPSDYKFCKTCGADLRIAPSARPEPTTGQQAGVLAQEGSKEVAVAPTRVSRDDTGKMRWGWWLLDFVVWVVVYQILFSYAYNYAPPDLGAKKDFWTQIVLWFRDLPGILQWVLVIAIATPITNRIMNAIRPIFFQAHTQTARAIEREGIQGMSIHAEEIKGDFVEYVKASQRMVAGEWVTDDSSDRTFYKHSALRILFAPSLSDDLWAWARKQGSIFSVFVVVVDSATDWQMHSSRPPGLVMYDLGRRLRSTWLLGSVFEKFMRERYHIKFETINAKNADAISPTASGVGRVSLLGVRSEQIKDDFLAYIQPTTLGREPGAWVTDQASGFTFYKYGLWKVLFVPSLSGDLSAWVRTERSTSVPVVVANSVTDEQLLSAHSANIYVYDLGRQLRSTGFPGGDLFEKYLHDRYSVAFQDIAA